MSTLPDGSWGEPDVLHVDMDSFYVSVEVLRDPSLAGKPVIVGGSGDRGVVASASYEARAFGVRSAMPSSRARRLCPNAIFVHGDHRRYGEVSKQIHEIFAEVTPHIEPIALDEAFLDVSGARRLLGSGEQIAWSIRSRIENRLGLNCSVGVAPNKLLAKLASEAAKPIADVKGVRPGRQVVVVEADQALQFLHAHPIRALWGVGPKTHDRLSALGVQTVADLARIPLEPLVASVGAAHGRHLFDLARGYDPRPVESHREAKSIGHEETFSRDIYDRSELDRISMRLADAVATRLRSAGMAARTVQLKLRFSDFSTITRSRSVADEVTTANAIVAVVRELLDARDVSPRIEHDGVRLLGVSTSHLAAPTGVQLSLDELMDTARADGPPQHGWSEVAATLDEIRQRFGSDAVVPGAALADKGRRDRRVGDELWGPGLIRTTNSADE
ncbi:MAG: DNA polymerase IV [Acidimicrobiales bacterium]